MDFYFGSYTFWKKKMNLKFPNIANIELLIVVPQGVDGTARKILNELRRDYKKVLDEFLSQNSKSLLD